MIQATPLPPGLDPLISDIVAPVLAFIVCVVVIGGVVRWILRSPVGEALAERLRRSSAATSPDDVRKQVGELLGEVQQLRTEVSELSERLDFAERLLAKSRESQRIAPGP